MAVPTSPAGRRPRLADRLAAARRRRFVGREAELALFGSALADPEPPFALLYVHGPGGVGKTLLLGEFARLAGEAGVPAVRLDGRDLDPSPPGFLAGLGRALDEPPDASPLETLAGRPHGVLMVDTYETLGPLDAWLRETLLPELPGGHLVVLAGRDRPAAGWLADPGWRDLIRVVPLRNLRPAESLAYLSARGVPAAQHPAVLSFTHGHPLALSLVADVAATGGDPTALAPEQRPDVVRALLGRFVQQLPGARHRQALEACAHVRVMTEALLASALGADDAHELFGWLRRLSFVEEGPYGLFPHDLAREVLDADLRWRNPESYLELHRRVRRFIVGHLREARGLERQQAFFDLLYLHRNNPVMRAMFDWETLGTAHVEPAGPQDREAVLAMVRRHEGRPRPGSPSTGGGGSPRPSPPSAAPTASWSASSPAWPCTGPTRATWRRTRPRPRPAGSPTATAPPGPARSWSTAASGWAPTATRARGRPGTCWPPPGPWSG
jgi:hypothetical protein